MTACKYCVYREMYLSQQEESASKFIQNPVSRFHVKYSGNLFELRIFWNLHDQSVHIYYN